ncbi:MAG TPA: oxidoreductase [Amnibacterium sp.]|jgi:NAD(P)-dependent dehydrogenase (short-subunit alcohol dehydrogenase family)|uniref:oxidoreductase n=1 Tax=Amnibacterium sp. TaxID=1872496 RepID=UPI002F940A2E
MTSASAFSVPDQTGRTVIVTGANSGLGFETSRRLAAAGAHVVLACRDLDRGHEAAARIGGSTEVRQLDTASLASVRAFAEAIDRPIDVLVNNAGIMAVDEARSADGFELQLATNFLGAFALTGLLLPRLTDRVVMLSSQAHRIGRIALDDLNWRRRSYSRWLAYGQSKLADLMFAYDLQHRFTAAGSRLRAVAAHPGAASTNLTHGLHMPPWVEGVSAALVNGLGQSAEGGALPTLYAATVRDLPGGSYIGPDGLGEVRGAPVIVGSTKASHNRDVQRLLTSEAERLTGVPIDVPA